jgi:hypothetical protein
MDVNAVIKAFYTLDWDQKDEMVEKLLEDSLRKALVVDALYKYGNSDAVPLLKKRLGGFLKKRESSKELRSRIQATIAKIESRCG